MRLPGEEAVNTALWKLINADGVALVHQGSCWFMSAAARQATICLRQFLFSHLTHMCTVLYMMTYTLFSQQSQGFLLLTPPGSFACAVKQQCRPLTWWTELNDTNKTLRFTFSQLSHCSTDNGRPTCSYRIVERLANLSPSKAAEDWVTRKMKIQQHRRSAQCFSPSLINLSLWTNSLSLT